MIKVLSAVALLSSLAISASAGPLTFDFSYAGLGSNVDLSITGQLQIDSSVLQTILADPLDYSLPMSDLESLSMTVVGSRLGNGTFTSADFFEFQWWGAGASFDFSQNLVGQGPTTLFCTPPFCTWGENPGLLNNGDFSFYNAGLFLSPSSPTNYELATLSGQVAALTSLQLVEPEPGAFSMVLVGGLIICGIARRRARP